MQKYQKNKAFSLIELLISLIVISLIVSAFTPILSKRLKYREIVLSKTSVSTDCSKIDSEGRCLMCENNICTFCSTQINIPEGYYVNPNISCDKKSCNDFDVNCKRCNASSCLECKSGYNLTADKKCIKELTCEDKFGKNCKSCDDTSCIACESATHILYKNKCYKIPTKDDCEKFGTFYDSLNRICVTKVNPSDEIDGAKGPSLPSSVVRRAKCTVSGIPCCWNANIANSANIYNGKSGNIAVKATASANETTQTVKALSAIKVDSGYSKYNYPVSKRTLCNWEAAVEICSNFNPDITLQGDWRLPDNDEINNWVNNIDSISRNLGAQGLQFCSQCKTVNNNDYCTNVAYNTEPICAIAAHYNSCCEGSKASHCHAYGVWALQTNPADSTKAYIFRFIHGAPSLAFSNKHEASSTRCVLDKFLEKE